MCRKHTRPPPLPRTPINYHLRTSPEENCQLNRQPSDSRLQRPTAALVNARHMSLFCLDLLPWHALRQVMPDPSPPSFAGYLLCTLRWSNNSSSELIYTDYGVLRKKVWVSAQAIAGAKNAARGHTGSTDNHRSLAT